MTEIEEEERRSDNDNARLQKQREVVQKAFNEAKAKADAEAKAKADAEAKAKAAATK
jgi:colicin import membrane protein